ncbi:MAG: potassium-transporting ATPase subunit KdpC [Saprospirales bacterium]|nr:potassium-transporting ATPase subunit KdpC [Saprospirales bacterium]
MFKTSLFLILATLLLFGVAYPLAIWGIGKLTPHTATGKPVERDGKVIGFENIGQSFHSPQYFWGRPSAVGYDASSTGGSNYGPSNPAYLSLVQQNIDTLLFYHPGKTAADIPVELVTASGGGLDPHISKTAALFQAERVARARNMDVRGLTGLIEKQTKGPYLGLFGPKELINVLKLNLALDELPQSSQQ